MNYHINKFARKFVCKFSDMTKSIYLNVSYIMSYVEYLTMLFLFCVIKCIASITLKSFIFIKYLFLVCSGVSSFYAKLHR